MMRKIRAIIVDDESAAQKTLIGMLGEFCPQVTVVAKSNNISEAIVLVEQHQPDLLFLDIQMSPYESGFDLLNRTKKIQYGVIFVTAFAQYAIKAINAVQPWAYLVKPFSSDDLMEAVRAAYKKIMENSESTTSTEDEHKGIVVSDARKGQVILRLKEIVYCLADQSVVEIVYLKQNQMEKIYTYLSLKHIQNQLPEIQFCRTHHGSIVNLAFVERFEKVGRSGVVYLTNGVELPVSVKKTEEFEQRLKRFLANSY
jgi:two-component system LytT family response regulator